MSKFKEHSSFANFNEARVVHSDYELDVDFGRKVIDGYAKVTVNAEVDGPQELIMDTSCGMEVHSVAHVVDGNTTPLIFRWGEQHAALGKPLHISLPPGLAASQKVDIALRFTTSPAASALQFLDPEQTAGGQQPYFFTQCQAIHARSFVPCQDTPAVKMSYSAAVRVPAQLRALMSAVPLEGDQPQELPQLAGVAPSYPTRVYHFRQAVPIPTYLLALAVGDLVSRQVGPRSRVWSEPCMVEAGAYEFADTAKFLDAGEALAGEYVWGVYDLLLLPPSFPYGGMENPCLTFVTPTLLAGDRSLTNVVAHEIAHSWTGNLVTNATWEHFWLNEGFTVFLERKILGRLHGEAFFQFEAAGGLLTLQDTVNQLGADHPFTALVPDLSGGVDPDDSFSSIPYEKGFYFLYYLQELVGGAAAFEPFFKSWIQAKAFSTATSADFRDYFMEHFRGCPAAAEVDWDRWFTSRGMPPCENHYDTSLAQAAFDLATRWHTSDVMGLGGIVPDGASAADVSGWSSDQVIAFLDKLGQLRALQPLHASSTQALARLYGLHASRNAEIRCALYKLCIPAEDATALEHCVDLLKTQGRMKFLRPLYRALFKSRMGRQLALDTFQQARSSYHPIAQKMVAADLGLK